MRHNAISLLAALALVAPAAHAQSVATAPGTTYQTQSIRSASTFATDMKGMRISAHFADGQVVDALAWNELDAETGEWGVASSLFKLSMARTDNTGSEGMHVWKLRSLGAVGLTRLVFSGGPGRTVFDAVYDEERTAGSAYGLPLAFAPVWVDDFTTVPSPYAATSTVTYRNAVALVGAAPLLDLFEQVDLQFGGALAAGAA